jgi:hypothetical protein
LGDELLPLLEEAGAFPTVLDFAVEAGAWDADFEPDFPFTGGLF